MATIYDYVYGFPYGQQQVCCCFHDDNKASAGVGPNGEFHCFTCVVSASDEKGFIAKYFNISIKKAESIMRAMERTDKYTSTAHPLTQEQRDYLHSIGIVDSVIDKYFIRQSNGKLIMKHTWNGVPIGTTWFNNPTLSNYNAGEAKYKYQGTIGGFVTPYDDVLKQNTILICEGEKDMLTAKSMGINNAVAKLGGANTDILPSIDFKDKNIIICYDCDQTGRDGAAKDAAILMEYCTPHVKVIDLGLGDKEDLNDYFIRYNHKKQDLYNLIKNTPEYVVPESFKKSKIERLLSSLNDDELAELKNLLLGGLEQ